MLIDDYNSYIPSRHIECLTGIRHYENVYASFYNLIAIVLGFMLACILAIAIEIIKRYSRYSRQAPDDEYSEETVEDAPIISDESEENITV